MFKKTTILMFMLLASVGLARFDGGRYSGPTASSISRAIEGKRSLNVNVAAANSSVSALAWADYVCDGADDDATIKAAIESAEINSFETYYSVTVNLAAGSYVFGDTLDLSDKNRVIRIVGSGTEVGTFISMPNAMKTIIQIGNSWDAPASNRVWLENLYVNNTILDKLDVASENITAVSTGSKTFTVAGDQTGVYTTERPLLVEASTGRLNDKYYTITDVSESGGNTVITVSETIPSAVVAGVAGQHSASWQIDAVAANTITINGADYTSLFTVGYPARVFNSTSGTNDGYYTISNAAYTGGNTVLTTTQSLTTGLAADGCVVANIPIVAAESWGHGGTKNCVFENSLGDGILVCQSEFLNFDNTLLKLNGFNGLHFAGYGSSTQNANYVRYCMFDQTRPTTTSCVRSTSYSGLNPLTRTQITNNWIKESAGDFVTLTNGSRYNRIAENVVEKIGSATTDTYYFVRLHSDSGQAGCRNNEVSNNIVYSANKGASYAVKAFVGNLNKGTSAFDNNDCLSNKFFGNPPHVERQFYGKTLEEGISTRTGVGATVTEVGKAYNIVTDYFKDVKARAVDNVLDITTIGTGGYYDVTTIPAVSNVDYPRNLSVTVTDSDAGGELACNVWVYYLDDKGQYKLSSTVYDFTPLTSATITGSFVVSDIIEIRVRDVAGVEAGDTITVGLGDMFGLSNELIAEYDIISVSKNGSTLGGRKMLLDSDTRSYKISGGTIDFGTDSADGDLDDVAANDDFVVRYRSSLNTNE